MTSPSKFYLGWDVGGWNCDKNQASRDALVMLNSELAIAGKPWRGNLRDAINESADTQTFIQRLFSLCAADLPMNNVHIALAIDAPLGFSNAFVDLVTRLQYKEPGKCSCSNPYLFRETERALFEIGLHPLSPIKDMIGSQATKGMHVLAKFAPTIKCCGVWSNGELLTAIEAYPAACKNSETLKSLRQRVKNQPVDNQDKMDALTCALIAYLFVEDSEALRAPDDSIPATEGWIWAPKDIFIKKSNVPMAMKFRPDQAATKIRGTK